MINYEIEKSSFKDRDSAVFVKNGEIYRNINFSYKEDYDKLIQSGLYEQLTNEKLLISHKEIENNDNSVYKIIKPQRVFITYPWEWSFSQLKDAAITTLKIQLEALNYGMTLKDANCYNIQFKDNKPILIDTASFEIYKDGEPWCAYKQFCENFLSVLALMAYKDIRLNKLLITNINGIPLDLTAKLLPRSAFFNLNLFFHIKLHANIQNKYADNKNKKVNIKINKQSQINLVQSLLNCVNNLKLKKVQTEWNDYYNFTNYNEESFNHKKEIITLYKEKINPLVNIWDFGANNGLFSRIFSSCKGEILSLDIDPLAVENNYLTAKKTNETNIRPILFDLVNPSPAVGWNNEERTNLITRSNNPDLVMALALIHHLRITYNIPFYKMRDYFAEIGKFLIIEFIEKEDSQIQKMLMNREDVFDDYNIELFEDIFSEKYNIIDKTQIINTNRYMYLMEKKS